MNIQYIDLCNNCLQNFKFNIDDYMAKKNKPKLREKTDYKGMLKYHPDDCVFGTIDDYIAYSDAWFCSSK